MYKLAIFSYPPEDADSVKGRPNSRPARGASADYNEACCFQTPRHGSSFARFRAPTRTSARSASLPTWTS